MAVDSATTGLLGGLGKEYIKKKKKIGDFYMRILEVPFPISHAKSRRFPLESSHLIPQYPLSG